MSTAQQMVDYYKHMPARIRSQPIHVQFSMHERLKVGRHFCDLLFHKVLRQQISGDVVDSIPASCTVNF